MCEQVYGPVNSDISIIIDTTKLAKKPTKVSVNPAIEIAPFSLIIPNTIDMIPIVAIPIVILAGSGVFFFI